MGIYNIVHFNCPVCNNRLDIQSSADDGFGSFDADKCPKETAKDLIDQKIFCDSCKNTFRILKKRIDYTPLGLLIVD